MRSFRTLQRNKWVVCFEEERQIALIDKEVASQ